MRMEKKRREGVEERRKKRRDIGVFYIKGREKKMMKKKRCVCYEICDSSLLIEFFYLWFYRRIIKN